MPARLASCEDKREHERQRHALRRECLALNNGGPGPCVFPSMSVFVPSSSSVTWHSTCSEDKTESQPGHMTKLAQPDILELSDRLK